MKQRPSLKNRYTLSVDAKACIPALISIVVLFVFGEILASGFASGRNIANILTQGGLLLIISIGQAIVFFAGNSGIDLSVGAFVSMGALIGAKYMNGSNAMIPVGVLIAMLFGAAFGAINGLGIQYLRIPALAMTLAMSSVVNGFTIWYTDGLPQAKIPPALASVGRALFGQVRPMMIIALIVIIVMEIIMRKTRFGRAIYMVGSNRQAAMLCGIPKGLISVLAYTISGALSCVGGILFIGYVGAGQLGMGEDYTMQSIAAVVIGGVSVNGGRGTFIGVTLGAIAYLLMSSVLVALGLDVGVRKFFQGIILAVILIANCRSPKLRK